MKLNLPNKQKIVSFGRQFYQTFGHQILVIKSTAQLLIKSPEARQNLIKKIKAAKNKKRIVAIAGFLLVVLVTLSSFVKSILPTPYNGLALNLDKATYVPGERAKISMASLSDQGLPLCHSNLKLEAKGPDGRTQDLAITTSPTCTDSNLTTEPDYVANLLLPGTGTYQLTLANLDNKHQISRSLEVKATRDFEVTRSSATRINPSKTDRYPMIITVKASKDYQGEIREQVPAQFKVAWQGEAKVEGSSLVWQVILRAGQAKSLGYEYVAPQVGPAVFTFENSLRSPWQVIVTKAK